MKQPQFLEIHPFTHPVYSNPGLRQGIAPVASRGQAWSGGAKKNGWGKNPKRKNGPQVGCLLEWNITRGRSRK